ncbi:sensor histidine kinase [Pseudothauera rhizosphaerae]|uniref:Sensor histidine kinase n=1 Tax=Pseudothauera rhizosphaerae TaxID=2565932 RepID=A0A4S4AZS8_9RHOO|nr:sensor histidine kinase [Pseudothauera rhizosphaerae]THF64135.1 sensor histidine kinase [Pseudothauera rhizosphaerae]
MRIYQIRMIRHAYRMASTTPLTDVRSQLAALSARLETAREEERERIAREVHDVLGGHLVAIKIETALLAARLDGDPALLRKRVNAIERLLDDAIAAASRITRELHPGILKDFGLGAAIECQAEDFSQRTGIACRIACADHDIQLPQPAAVALFRIFQEALTNVCKHAQASRVEVRLTQEGDEVLLEVVDDGKGLAPADLDKPLSSGLRGMRERLASLGGRLELGTASPAGTRLVLAVPLAAEPQTTGNPP